MGEYYAGETIQEQRQILYFLTSMWNLKQRDRSRAWKMIIRDGEWGIGTDLPKGIKPRPHRRIYLITEY